MSYEKNKWLEQYEIKAPDYDFKEREYYGMKDVVLEPTRFHFVEDGGYWEQNRPSNTGKARLMFAGDITVFERQIEEARIGDSEDYDFNYVFEPISHVFKQADLVVGNIETMLSESSPYRTELYVSEQDFNCNAPTEILDGLKNCGFDVLTNANNHDLDTGVVGLAETIDNIVRFGFIQTGTFKDQKKRYEVIDVNGIKVGIVAYGTDHNGKGVNISTEGRKFMLHDYSRIKAKNNYTNAKKDGADIVICCMHWGKENHAKPHSSQHKYAQELADIGFDCIIGSHSHVLQPFDIVEASDGRKVPVFYCMGNFISHNFDNVKSRAIVAVVDAEKTDEGTKLELSYIPVFTSENYNGRQYVILPIPKDAQIEANVEKKELIKKDIGELIDECQTIDFQEFEEGPVEGLVRLHKDDVPELNEETVYPLTYDAGKFIYRIYEDHIEIIGITEGRPQVSYTNSRRLLGLPVTEIVPGAFEGHPVMKKFKFMENIIYIRPRVCKGCPELEGFRMGTTTQEIQEEAFADCPKLNSAVFRRSLKRVGKRAFANCTNLRSVKISSSVEYIADDAFENCGKLVFYCHHNEYAEKYARDHGFEVVKMEFTGRV
ncbi:MAG: CapA family protein [Firmicutes bacterium]|nr:CapA family protein [Bacillota bacterium]